MSMITLGLIAQTIGSALLLGGYAPQIFKLHKTKNPTGISLLFWIMIATGCTSILINMIIQDVSFEIQLTQALNGLFAWYTFFLVLYCKKKKGDSIKLNNIAFSSSLFITGYMITFSMNNTLADIGLAFQTIGTVALLTAYLPQIFYLFKVKDASGLSPWLFLILSSGLLFVTTNMIITRASIEIIVTEFVNILLIEVLYIMTIFYQIKNKKLLNKSIDIK